jgi:superoxide dismutase, Cu-Zn family
VKRLHRSIAAGLAAIFVAGTSVAQVPPQHTRYEVPGASTFPEGIAYHAASGALFVSGAGSGAIYRIDVASGEAEVFVEEGSQPTFHTLGLLVDDDSLWVAGGIGGTVARYDLSTGALDRTFETTPADATAINDLVMSPNGDVFVTDSFRPILFRIPAGSTEIEAWLDLDGTVFAHQEGVNANGIEISDDGRFLIVVSMNSGELYRIDTSTREVMQIDVEGGPFPGGDGLWLDGTTLYIAQQGVDQVSVVELNDGYGAGSTVRTIVDDSFAQIATIAFVGRDLVVVNSQFGAMETGAALPFALTVIPDVR